MLQDIPRLIYKVLVDDHSVYDPYLPLVSVRCPPPNGCVFGALVSTIDSGYLGALYGGKSEEAVLVGLRETFDLRTNPGDGCLRCTSCAPAFNECQFDP